MHLILSAGRMVIYWSLFSDSIDCLVGQGWKRGLALERAADTFNLSSSTLVLVRLFLFIADSVNVMKW